MQQENSRRGLVGMEEEVGKVGVCLWMESGAWKLQRKIPGRSCNSEYEVLWV